MKYKPKIVAIILLLFIATQLIGIFVGNHYFKKELPYKIEKPKLPEAQKTVSFLPIMFFLLIITFIAVMLIRFRAVTVWRAWFFLGIAVALLISFSAFIPEPLALAFAISIAAFKVYRPNFFVHNIGELFVYSGLAALFVPLLNIISISLLLVGISIYDIIAVWKTKHMIKLAKFQAQQRMFAGLLVPYKEKKKNPGEVVRFAILGGGDVGFPMLFIVTVLRDFGMTMALTSLAFVSIALLLLLIFAQKNRYYPAMPYLSIGCFAGFLVGLLATMV